MSIHRVFYTHKRDILVYVSSKRILYEIPLFKGMEDPHTFVKMTKDFGTLRLLFHTNDANPSMDKTLSLGVKELSDFDKMMK